MHILVLWKSNGKGSSCFSQPMKKPNCQSCCLFGNPSATQKEWGQRCVGQPEEQITREKQAHLDGRRGNALIETDATFWRKYLLRIINIVMTLAMMSLALRGHREHVSNGNCHGDNFLALVAMQAQSLPVLQDLLQTPARTATYMNTTSLSKPKSVYSKARQGPQMR